MLLGLMVNAFVFLFFVVLFIFLLFICRSSLCVLDTNPLSDACIESDVLLACASYMQALWCKVHKYLQLQYLLEGLTLYHYKAAAFVSFDHFQLSVQLLLHSYDCHLLEILSSHPFTLSLGVSSKLKWVSCEQHIVGSCFLGLKKIHWALLYLLIGEFNLFMFKAIIDTKNVVWRLCSSFSHCLVEHLSPVNLAAFLCNSVTPVGGRTESCVSSTVYLPQVFPLWSPRGYIK